MWISGCCVHSYRCDPPQRDQMRGSGAKWMEEPHLQSFKTAEQTFILKSQASHYRDKTLVHSLFSSAAGSTRVRMCLYGLTSLSGTLYPLCRPSPPPLLHPAGPLWLLLPHGRGLYPSALTCTPTLSCCPAFLSVAVVNTTSKSNLEGLFQLALYSPSSREARVRACALEAGTWGRTEVETTERCLLACFSCLFLSYLS